MSALREKKSQDTTHWRKENRSACSSKTQVCSDIVVKDTNCPNQAPDAARIKVLNSLITKEELTTTYHMMSQRIFGSASPQLPDSATVQLPKITSVKKSLRKKRLDTLAAPEKQEQIAAYFRMRSRSCLQENSSCSMPALAIVRFKVFGTSASLATLRSCFHIFMEHTFKSSHSIF